MFFADANVTFTYKPSKPFILFSAINYHEKSSLEGNILDFRKLSWNIFLIIFFEFYKVVEIPQHFLRITHK